MIQNTAQMQTSLEILKASEIIGGKQKQTKQQNPTKLKAKRAQLLYLYFGEGSDFCLGEH